jgi:hypothetical protein
MEQDLYERQLAKNKENGTPDQDAIALLDLASLKRLGRERGRDKSRKN